MIAKSLRAMATALLIGTATVAAVSLSAPTVAEAAGVRPQVGKALNEAISLAKKGDGSAALAKVREAEAVKGLTATEKKTIAETKHYVEVTTGPQARIYSDYQAGRYRAVVTTDADLLRKAGAMNSQYRYVIAGAYFKLGEYRETLNTLRGMGDSDNVVTLRMAAASKLGDNAAVRSAAETMVLKGQKKYWGFLLTAADNTAGLSDAETFGVYRIRYLTGQMRNAGDYSNAAQLAILLGFPHEGEAIEQKGFDDKVLSDARQQRLLNQAKKLAAEQLADLGATAKAAEAAKTGDKLIKLAEIYWGLGRYQDALDAAQSGIKKGVTDDNHAQVVLGMAYTGLRKSSQALRAFAKVKHDPKAEVVARLWSVYARTK